MQPTNNYYGGSVGPVGGQTGGNPLRKRTPLLIFLVILVLLTIILGVVSTLKGKGSSSGKSGQLFSLIKKGDGVKSYELLSTGGKASITKEQWIDQVIQLKTIIGKDTPKQAYSQKLDKIQTETAYNVGAKGSIYRITIITQQKGGQIDSITYNKTSL